jgi:hypothetical protein
MLQADLNERTARHEQGVAAATGNQAANDELTRESRDLAAEQGQLAELVQKMLSRDNEQQEQP